MIISFLNCSGIISLFRSPWNPGSGTGDLLCKCNLLNWNFRILLFFFSLDIFIISYSMSWAEQNVLLSCNFDLKRIALEKIVNLPKFINQIGVFVFFSSSSPLFPSVFTDFFQSICVHNNARFAYGFLHGH